MTYKYTDYDFLNKVRPVKLDTAFDYCGLTCFEVCARDPKGATVMLLWATGPELDGPQILGVRDVDSMLDDDISPDAA